MKLIIPLLLSLHFSATAQIIDTIIFIDPNPDYDTSLYVDIQFGNTRIDNDIYANEFIGQQKMKFVGYHRQQIDGYYFVKGELIEAQTGKTADIYENGIISPEVTDLLINADETIFYMVIEFIDRNGKQNRQKSKFLVHGSME